MVLGFSFAVLRVRPVPNARRGDGTSDSGSGGGTALVHCSCVALRAALVLLPNHGTARNCTTLHCTALAIVVAVDITVRKILATVGPQPVEPQRSAHPSPLHGDDIAAAQHSEGNGTNPTGDNDKHRHNDAMRSSAHRDNGRR